MANVIARIIEISGTTSGVGLTEDIAFAGGTQLNKMFHVGGFWGEAEVGNAQKWNKGSELTSAGNLRIYNGVTPNTPASYRFFVICYTAASDLVVTRYQTNIGAAFGTTVVDAGNQHEHFALYHGRTQTEVNDLGTYSQAGIRSFSLATTLVTLFTSIVQSGRTASSVGYSEVIQLNNADVYVQQFNDFMTPPDLVDTVTGNPLDRGDGQFLTAVDWSRAWIYCTQFYDIAASIPRLWTPEITIISPTSLSVSLPVNPGNGLGFFLTVIEDRAAIPQWRVTDFDPSMANAELTDTVPQYSTVWSFLAAKGASNGGWTGVSNDTTAQGLRSAVCDLSAPEPRANVNAERATAGATTLSIQGQLIEFLQVPVGVEPEDGNAEAYQPFKPDRENGFTAASPRTRLT